ncbi:hypothetical protein U5922_002820 [Aquicoccus sp. G2-2]|uniref:hypothetical protein n=1 Tax=Aquicoccus sp. G2-2 TaxID=3092120 RepID=UPI002AE009AF|nr:hypothetical protein [Aquicoccus sp. G2-2]MEA1112453.1 hypothetical protein [Aquicoccus sp. G2-2]
MSILRAVLAGLWSMFVADARLSLAIFVLVALCFTLAATSPIATGFLLALGAPAILIAAVWLAARK